MDFIEPMCLGGRGFLRTHLLTSYLSVTHCGRKQCTMGKKGGVESKVGRGDVWLLGNVEEGSSFGKCHFRFA